MRPGTDQRPRPLVAKVDGSTPDRASASREDEITNLVVPHMHPQIIPTLPTHLRSNTQFITMQPGSIKTFFVFFNILI
jgi:hypothetical protein